jgi:hypothetical protein
VPSPVSHCIFSPESTDDSYGNDEFLALSVDSANPDAADCYRIVRERNGFRLDRASQIVTAAKGTQNIAIAVSQAYDAVAFLSKQGISTIKMSLIIGAIQIRPEGQLPGTLGSHGVVYHHERVSLAFDGTGQKLIYIDEKVLYSLQHANVGGSNNV